MPLKAAAPRDISTAALMRKHVPWFLPKRLRIFVRTAALVFYKKVLHFNHLSFPIVQFKGSFFLDFF